MADLTPAQTNAYDASNAFLQTLGLNPADFRDLVTNAAVNNMDATEFAQLVQTQPAFTRAFPEIEARQKAGLAPMKAAEILAFRDTAKDLARNYNLPPGFMNQDTITNLVAGDVSPQELQNRIANGYAAVQNAPQDVKDTLFSYYGDQGLTEGHLLGFMLDPTKGLDLINRDIATANIGATAGRSGFGKLSAQEAGGLQAAGVTQGQAEQGFGALAREGELFGALPGEQGAPGITREQQLGTLEAPTGETQQELERRARQRKATFGGGGDLLTGATGVTGLAQSR